MASYSNPGGGVQKGANAQEEFLCRISNLYLGLTSTEAKRLYPLKEGFIVENVTFFRDENYQKLHKPITADVITISAPRFPDSNRELKSHQIAQIDDRIQKLIKLCIAGKYDAIVLSAFGCGAYNNPVDIVASHFYHYFVELNYQEYFKSIVFAIINDRNSTGDNYEIFNSILTS
jgi:uncharacterized protein (TIGR02452 family)